MGVNFDATISLGNIVSAAAFLVMALFGWRDLTWRIKNLEQWRNEHMIDSDARDKLITGLDKILALQRWQIKNQLGLNQPPPDNEEDTI